jgi:hypothetical protein
MDDSNVKTILTSELQMMKQSLNDNCRKFFFGIHKFKACVSWALAKLVDVFT